MTPIRRPEVSLYRRNAAHVTSHEVFHPLEKDAAIAELPLLKRKRLRQDLEAGWLAKEEQAAGEALPLIEDLTRATKALHDALEALRELGVPELRGKVEAEQQRTTRAKGLLETAHSDVINGDFGAAGGAVHEATRELWLVGGHLIVSLNQVLAQAAIGKGLREKLRANMSGRQQAKAELEARKGRGPAELLPSTARVYQLEAAGFVLAAEVLGSQVKPVDSPRVKLGREGALRVIPPQELETFEDVGGLDEVKDELRATVGAILESPDEAARYSVVHNGILFHGPPGTGKTLLSRALAGEYGLRYIRFSPASIASAYMHEAAANLNKLFELAAENTPCVLFLDEVDTIASPRDDQPSADHREVVTQLMNSLEEFRTVPGLIVVAATNNIDRLDPGLREGRFDAKILVPLPDPAARKSVFEVHLKRRGKAVAWDSIDYDELSRRTGGRNAAAIESFVSVAAQISLRKKSQIGQSDLVEAIQQREGKDRRSLDEPVRWDDVVLPDDVREQIMEILNIFAHPDLAVSLGVKPPAGILLYGPPGTGKTTIAKALATEVEASFYEQSAGDMLSKWVGESEERIMKLFSKARANRPSVIFVDEIDSLLRQRNAQLSNPWEDRVVSQFLRELDGLTQVDGVLLVGATNRIDIIDPAIQGRRLTPIEIGLPDVRGRVALLNVLLKDVNVAADVDIKLLATSSEGMSGADLKRLRDAAGMKALSRAARDGVKGDKVAITAADFQLAIETQKEKSSLVQV